MRPSLRSAALCVIILMGATPTATLACEWACAPAAGQAHQQGGHHHGAGPSEATDTSAGASLGTTDAPCDHAGDALAAITVASVKVFAPGVAPSVDHGVAVLTSTTRTTVSPAASSPPGVRSRPLSLRI